MIALPRHQPAHEYVLPASRQEDPRVAALLACFRAPAGERTPPRTLIVGAHPDDETMGPGGMLPRFPDGTLEVLHVTDGAPRNRRQWGRNEHATWDEYAAARRAEVLRALAVAGIAPERAHRLGVMDAEAALDMAGLTRSLRDAFDRLRPEVVITHPYEGGHTDHDATAFAARAACRLLERDGARPPALMEFTSYFNLRGERIYNRFLPFDGAPVTEVTLTPAERDRKRRMFDVYHTQHGVLRDMPVRFERYRPAPRYDFGAAPHAGRLRYELYPQGMQGKRWRALALEAFEKLGLPRFY
ncbi:PIG-L family deacetylase [Longimicrobium sp.]|uniref:PIG-L deacetylase family protein n=1 Tax=Longimicrobium sp. TaxID=2029185 RepID=UPI002BCABA34|nr:PIG-L family deacetylase [Longimicrobium sp.]HSU14502.1 PIG-L family deacetylase [Longimicrobium sp.]